MSKELFNQPLKTAFGGTDRVALGIPGQDGCDNMLVSVFLDLIKNVGVKAESFVNADLIGNVLTITHGENTQNVEVIIYDNNGVLQDISGMLSVPDPDYVEIDFGGAIDGAWRYILKYWNL